MTDHPAETATRSVFDLAIMGGGAAGLTLALQMSAARPDTSIVVVERNRRAPEAAHKVGESTVDIGASYLRDVLRLETHMTTEQLDKFGLRFFFSQGDNRDITRRVELGHAAWPVHVGATYQIDRGRFENSLSDELVSRGIDVWAGCRVLEVDVDNEPNRLSVTCPSGDQREIQARWVVDATGRSSIVKRQLGLARQNGHDVNAVWFRIDHPIDIDEWSDDPAWHDRIIDGQRRLSTNHLMGEGYWVWLIPLASNATSVGIVADPAIHPFDRLNRFEQALQWLHEHEPQCADAVEQHRDELLDFRVMRNYSYACAQVYSERGWCLTGEAGIFLDPLYSPGFDVISMSNGLITDLVTRSLDGEDVSDLAAIHNNVFFLLTDSWLSIYRGQYPLMGNARVMKAKIIWDTAVYWAVPALLHLQDQLRRLADRPHVVAQLARVSAITEPIQRFFREWYAVERSSHADAFVAYYDFDFMVRFHNAIASVLSDDELDEELASNLDLLEQLAGRLVATVTAECAQAPAGEARSLQADRWRADESLMRLVDLYNESVSPDSVNDAWIRLEPGEPRAEGGGYDTSQPLLARAE